MRVGGAVCVALLPSLRAPSSLSLHTSPMKFISQLWRLLLTKWQWTRGAPQARLLKRVFGQQEKSRSSKSQQRKPVPFIGLRGVFGTPRPRHRTVCDPSSTLNYPHPPPTPFPFQLCISSSPLCRLPPAIDIRFPLLSICRGENPAQSRRSCARMGLGVGGRGRPGMDPTSGPRGR